jgi:6-pyruvoyl-tetrahydropterin synthase
MVIDLDVLDAAMRDVAGQVDGQDLEGIRPPEAEAVTVEVFARWAHDQLEPTARQAGADELGVRVWESADAFGGYRAAISSA